MSASPMETGGDVEKLREAMRATYQEHEQILDEIESVEAQIADLEKENNEKEMSERETALKIERNENEIKLRYQEIRMREETITKQKETYKLLLSQNEMLVKKLQDMELNSERNRRLWQERLDKLDKDTAEYLATLESFPWYQEKKAAVDERDRQRKIQEDLEQKIKETKEESEKIQKQIDDSFQLPWVKFCSKLARMWLQFDEVVQEVEKEKKLLDDKEQQLIKQIEQVEEEQKREAEEKAKETVNTQTRAGAGGEREPEPVFKIPTEIPEHSRTQKVKDRHCSKDPLQQGILNREPERQDKRATEGLMSGGQQQAIDGHTKKKSKETESDLAESVCSQRSSLATGSLMGLAAAESESQEPDPQPIGDFPPIMCRSQQSSQASSIGPSISQMPAANPIQKSTDPIMAGMESDTYRPASRASTFSETSQSSGSSVLSTASDTRKPAGGFNLQRASLALGMNMVTGSLDKGNRSASVGANKHRTTSAKPPVHSILSARDDQGQNSRRAPHQKTVAFAPSPQPSPNSSFSTESPQSQDNAIGKAKAIQKTVSTIDTAIFTTTASMTGVDHQGGKDQRMGSPTPTFVPLPANKSIPSPVPKKTAAVESQGDDEDNFLTIFGASSSDHDSDEDDGGRSSRGFSFNFGFNKAGANKMGGEAGGSEKAERAKEIEIAKKKIQGLANPFDFDDENPFA